jgi:hypothetical protein
MSEITTIGLDLAKHGSGPMAAFSTSSSAVKGTAGASANLKLTFHLATSAG